MADHPAFETEEYKELVKGMNDRDIGWRLRWIDRRRAALKAELDDLDHQEREALGLKDRR